MAVSCPVTHSKACKSPLLLNAGLKDIAEILKVLLHKKIISLVFFIELLKQTGEVLAPITVFSSASGH